LQIILFDDLFLEHAYQPMGHITRPSMWTTVNRTNSAISVPIRTQEHRDAHQVIRAL